MKFSAFGKSPSPKTRKRLRWMVGLVLFYTVFGFLILPLIIKAVAVKVVGKELRRETSIESVRLNPYALSATIRGLNIKDPDAQTLVSWDEVYVNVQLASLFRWALVLDEVRVIHPYARVQLNRDMSFNFSDILAAHALTNDGTRPVEPSRPLAVAVRHFRVEGARLAFTDLTPRKPFNRVIGPVKIELNNFHTDPNNNNPHVFTGSTDTGETFTWGGRFSVEPVRAVGEFSVENIALKELAPLYQDLVRFEIRDGVAGFHVNYTFEMTPAATNASVSNLSVTLRSLKVAEPGKPENLFELSEFLLGDVSGDLLARTLDVGAVTVRGAGLDVRRGVDAKLNILEAATPNVTESAPGGVLLLLQSATNLLSRLLASSNLATAVVRDVSVKDCVVRYQDEACSPPARLIVDQIGLTARNLSNRPDTNMTAGFSLRWNTNGTLAVNISAGLDPLQADVDLDLKRLNLAPLDPYLRPHVNAYVLGSKVSLDGRVQVRARPGTLPEATFHGGGALDDLNVLGSTSEDLLRWGTLQFGGVAATLQPMSVTVSNITLKDLAARVVIETNKTINVLAVLPEQDTNSTETVSDEAIRSSAAGGAVRGGAIKEAFAQLKTVLGMNANFTADMGLPRVEVGAIRVENADVEFLDRSVTPPARASLQQIQAQITGVSTEEMRRAKIHVRTLVGGTGPVEVTAELNPLHAKDATHAQVSLKNVQLTPADPYAGKFLGYRLTRGTMNVDVDYTISASALKGRNRIVLDQLTLGGKVQSPDATSLPVKLGIALLKDSSGKIEIEVPVEGNLDDPKFRLGKVIWGVVANVFVKAVTSPFSLLGSLVGGSGGEDMQFQEFAGGSSELGPGAREKLATLAKALGARPGLQVVVEGNVDQELDGWELRRARMEQQLRLARWNSLRASARENLKPEDITIPPEIRSDLVRREYRALVATNAQYAFVTVPAAVAQSRTNVAQVTGSRSGAELEKGASRLLSGSWTPPSPANSAAGQTNAATEMATAPTGKPTLEQMENSLTAAQNLSAEDCATLASARAQRVQLHLVQDLKVAADRVLIGDAATGTFGTNGNRVVLQLQ